MEMTQTDTMKSAVAEEEARRAAEEEARRASFALDRGMLISPLLNYTLFCIHFLFR